jgi:hypothetical protein
LQAVLTGAPNPATAAPVSRDDLLNKMKLSAKGVLPHLSEQIDNGLSLKDIGENYKQYAAQILERDPSQINMFDGPFLDAFGNKETGQLALGDWVAKLKSDPRYGYQNTKAANRDAQSLALTIAKAFGANVIYYSTSGKNDNSEFEKTTLSRLIENSDVVSIHAPLNSSTENLISHSELLQMKDGAVLLNLGRGGIVDEDALSVIIDVKPIYVGLDVLIKEPMSTPHSLLSVKYPERLYITPHIAWTSIEARERLIAATVENIKTFLESTAK